MVNSSYQIELITYRAGEEGKCKIIPNVYMFKLKYPYKKSEPEYIFGRITTFRATLNKDKFESPTNIVTSATDEKDLEQKIQDMKDSLTSLDALRQARLFEEICPKTSVKT